MPPCYEMYAQNKFVTKRNLRQDDSLAMQIAAPINREYESAREERETAQKLAEEETLKRILKEARMEELDRRENDLDARENDLSQNRNTFRTERLETERNLNSLRSTLDRKRAGLEETEKNLAGIRSNLETSRERLDTEKEEFNDFSRQEREEIAREKAEISRLKEQLRQEAQNVERDRQAVAALQKEVARREEAIDRRAKEMDARKRALDEKDSTLAVKERDLNAKARDLAKERSTLDERLRKEAADKRRIQAEAAAAVAALAAGFETAHNAAMQKWQEPTYQTAIKDVSEARRLLAAENIPDALAIVATGKVKLAKVARDAYDDEIRHAERKNNTSTIISGLKKIGYLDVDVHQRNPKDPRSPVDILGELPSGKKIILTLFHGGKTELRQQGISGHAEAHKIEDVLAQICAKSGLFLEGGQHIKTHGHSESSDSMPGSRHIHS